MDLLDLGHTVSLRPVLANVPQILHHCWWVVQPREVSAKFMIYTVTMWSADLAPRGVKNAGDLLL
jgi:hypothetical protein